MIESALKKKQIIERYKQLRLLILRAKEDAARWGTNDKALLLRGINETSAHDFSIYDEAYNKIVQKRMKSMEPNELQEAKNKETKKKDRLNSSSLGEATRSEFELARIADALERIADFLENELDSEIK